VKLGPLLDMLLIDELEKVCKFLGVDHKAHRREALVARLLAADAPPPPLVAPPPAAPAAATPPRPAGPAATPSTRLR
jgi:hypothetical protein